MTERRMVVILCGPPGAGKTTIANANTLGLEVYDTDDPRWRSEQDFTKAIARLRTNPSARAVVIRSAPTSTARTRWRTLVGATHCHIIATEQQECAARIRSRARRDRVPNELVALRKWWTRHERIDHVRDWPGWDKLGPGSAPPPMAPRQRPLKGTGKYGHTHRVIRADWQRRIDDGEDVRCWRCSKPIRPGDAWDLGHVPGDPTQYAGPECVGPNRSDGARRSHANRASAPIVPIGEQQTRTW